MAAKKPKAPAKTKCIAYEMTEKQKELAALLTPLQLGTALNHYKGNMSQREAYYTAGGKAKTHEAADVAAAKVLRSAKVEAFRSSLIGAAISDAVMTKQEALERLTLIARVSITDIAEFNEVTIEGPEGQEITQTTWRIKNSSELSPEAAAAIKSVTATKMGPKLELHNSIDAIKQIADFEGWAAPKKRELSGPNGGPIPMEEPEISDEKLQEELIKRGLMPKPKQLDDRIKQ